MFFGQLRDRVDQRVVGYGRSRQPGTVLSQEALVEAAELWQAAQPADPEQPTPEDNQRLAVACYYIGRLHVVRCHAMSGEGAEYYSEVARAVAYLAPLTVKPLAYNSDPIPEPLQTLLGGVDDADRQASVAADLLQHAMATPDPLLLGSAIWLLNTACATATRHDHPNRAGMFYNLAIACWVQFERDGELANLDRTIESYEGAVAAASEEHHNRTIYLYNLGTAYQTRFERGGVPADFDKAIENYELAVAAAPTDHHNRHVSLFNLGNAYQVRFERDGVLADIDQAIEIGSQAVVATPSNDPNRHMYLTNLGGAYRARFDRSGVPADIDKAIENYERAIVAAPSDHFGRALHLHNLGTAYQTRFDRSGVPGDIDKAIENYELAAAATPEDAPKRARYLSDLGGAYRKRFERCGVLIDLEKAIKIGRLAVAVTPSDSPDRAGRLSNLGAAYGARFDRSGVPADIDQAIENYERAVADTSEDHPERAVYLSNLGGAYRRRFERGGALADLDQAVDVGEQAVVATPDRHPGLAGRLSNLGVAFRVRFERSGVLADLDKAIEIGRRAVAAAPEDHPDRGMFLSNLGLAYWVRFDDRGVLADLDQAVENHERAVAATPEDHPDRAGWLSNLGTAYRRRFGRRRVLADLDQAIENYERAAAATPDDHPNQAAYLSNLSGAYRARFDHSGVLADLKNAIKLGLQALAAAPVDRPDRGMYLSNLGRAYETQFEHSGVLADIEKAIENYERAVAATPEDHPDQARYLSNLGTAYRVRWDAGGQDIDPHTLRTLARQVATAAATAPPVDQVWSGRVVGSLAHAANEHTIAVELLNAAVNALASVAPREAGWTDQEHRIGEHRGLVGEAVAAHCAINDPSGAIEAAELSRGILLAAQLDSRSDVTDLDHAHPDLAAEFRRVREQLNTRHVADTAPTSPSNDQLNQIEQRTRLWSEHDQLLAQIRHQPGFTQFLRPPRLADLQPAIAEGAVILVNTGRQRSDAIIVTALADPVCVPLPDARIADVVSYTQALLDATHENSPVSILRGQRVVPEILGWAWDAIVEPTLSALPPTAEGTSTLPRVWWLPTGLLGLLPLHAAGHLGHSGALDAVVSSYIPTLRALAHARTRPPASVRRQLAVALHHTAGLPDLPGTVAEVTNLLAAHPDGRVLLDEEATTSRVLTALPEATWAHFACHASANPTTPSQGGLALYDATLALPEISQLQLNHAELAYLSACSTAHRGILFADESLHLASAFHLAGFRHVIASLWPVNDRVAASAAAAVYQDLTGTPTAEHAATALHHVTRELRARNPDRPDLWAALIHSGP